MKPKYFLRLLLLLISIFTLFLTSCKTDNTSKSNTVTIRMSTEPEKLNPLITEESNTLQVMSNIFMQLLDFDPKTLNLMPVLAKNRPTIALIDTGAYKGGMAITYEIRDEAAWDNGKPVTAEDYIFTVKMILNKKSGANNLRSGLDYVKDIVVDAQNTKKFTIFCNKRSAFSEVQTGTIAVLPENVYDTEGVMKSQTISALSSALKDTTSKVDERVAALSATFQSPKFTREKAGVVGCGAYALEEWVPEQRIVLKKKANWWGDKLADAAPQFKALPEQLVYKLVKDNQTALTLMQNGELDVMSKIPAKAFADMQKDPKMAEKYMFETAPSMSIAHTGFNCKSPKLNDKKVRHAIAYLFDNQAYIKTLMGGYASPCAGPFVPERPYYDSKLALVTQDVEKAKTLLAEAGWKDSNNNGTVDKNIGGKTTEMSLRFLFAANNDVAKNIGLMVQDAGKKAGIEIVLVPLEAKVLFENFKKRDFEMFVNSSAFNPGLDDPKELWATSSNTPDGGNRFQFENKQADALMEQIRAETNEEKRNALYIQFQQLIYNEHPAVFMFSPKERLAINKRFAANAYAKRPGYVVSEFKLNK